MGAAARYGGGNLAWWIAGALLAVLIVVVALPILKGQGTATTQPPMGPPTGAAASPLDLSSMTPREVADRLFNRVMSSAEAGDSADVAFFLSKAITSYDMARPLDADGLFHLALLHQTAGDYQASLTAALEVLDSDPDHLLNLAAAAEAAHALGDSEAARGYYQHLLDVYDVEIARDREEYRLHSTMVARLREEAETFLGGR